MDFFLVMKGLDERIDEGVLWWFVHVENDRIAKRVYVEVCCSHSVGRPQKRWIDTMKDCLSKKKKEKKKKKKKRFGYQASKENSAI